MISNRKLLILPITILILIVSTFVQGGEWVRPFGNTSINIVVQNITANAEVEGWIVSGNFLFNDTLGTLVGIGTATPDFELDVIGVINGSNFTGATDCAKIFGGIDSDFCVDGGGGDFLSRTGDNSTGNYTWEGNFTFIEPGSLNQASIHVNESGCIIITGGELGGTIEVC